MPDLERSVLAVDVVLFGLRQGELHLVLTERDHEPFRGRPSLPGVAVQEDETLAQAALRALQEKAGIAPEDPTWIHLEQLATFDALFRDPRGRTVSVAYLGLAREEVSPATGSTWRPVVDLLPGTLPFDHNEIVDAALARLRGKLRYTGIAAHLLPERFRIEELRAVYEALLGRRLNRSNFRSKLLKIGLIEQVGIDSDHVGRRGGRPPHLYRFARRGTTDQERDFL